MIKNFRSPRGYSSAFSLGFCCSSTIGRQAGRKDDGQKTRCLLDLYRLVHGRMRPVETKKGCRPTRQPSRILVQVESRFRFEPRRRDTNTHAKEAFRGRLPTQRVSSALDVVSQSLNCRFRPLNLHVPVTQFLRVNSRNFMLSFSFPLALSLFPPGVGLFFALLPRAAACYDSGILLLHRGDFPAQTRNSLLPVDPGNVH